VKCEAIDVKMFLFLQSPANKSHFHKKNFALSASLKVRVFELGNGLSRKDSKLNLNFTQYIALEMTERNCESGSHYHGFSWEYLILHPHLPQVRNFSRAYNKT